MSGTSKPAGERPILSTWNAYDQIELIISLGRSALAAARRELEATHCDRAHLRRRAEVLRRIADALERVRDDLERSVER